MGKKRKLPSAIVPAQIQFRPNDGLTEQLGAFCEAHSIPANEAARRLILLAVNHMTVDFYPFVASLEETMPGSQSFAQVCQFLAIEIDREDRRRLKDKLPPLCLDDRLEIAKRVVVEFGGAEALGDRDEQRTQLKERRIGN